MHPRRLALTLTALAIFSSGPALAQTEVPHYVNFQSVLRDDSGNLVEDGFVDLNFKILDQDSDVVYEETQPGVQVVRSAINVMIGEGIEPGSSPAAPTGGIPVNVLDPANGNHFLQIQFGSNLPSDPMELGSVPYAMYAERALSFVGEFPASQIPDEITRDTELATAIQAHSSQDIATAHPNGNLPTSRLAGQISNGQIADNAVTSSKIQDGAVTTSDIADNTISLDDIFTDEATPTSLDYRYVNEIGDTMTGDLNMGGNNVTNAGNFITNSGYNVNDHENRISQLEANDPGSTLELQYPSDSSRASASGQTVGAISNIIYSKTLDDNAAYILRASFSILNSTQTTCRNYTRDGLFRRNGGGAVEVSDDQVHAFGPGSPRVEWQASGNAAQLVAVGAAGETVNYNGWIELVKVSQP